MLAIRVCATLYFILSYRPLRFWGYILYCLEQGFGKAVLLDITAQGQNTTVCIS